MDILHPITLLTGSAAAGKSSAIIDLLREPRKGKALVVVPSGLQKRWLREQAGTPPRVDFRQFYGLADQVLRTTGEPPGQLDEALRGAVVRTVMRDLAAAGQLPMLQRVCAKHGFVDQVGALLTALQDNEAQPDALAAAHVSPYDGELAAMYARYLEWQEAHDVADVPRRLLLARDGLRGTPGLFRSYSLLIIDGFDQFTPIQLSLIAELTRQIPRTVITLTYEQEERPALRRFERTFYQLRDALDPAVVPLPTRPQERHPTLRFLSDNLFALDERSRQQADGSVQLIEAADREREVRAALRRVKRLIESGVPPHEIGILLRDGGEYSPLLREVAAEYALPLALADGLPLADVPAISALVETLRLPLDDYPRRNLIDAWRARGAAFDQALPAPLADADLDWDWAASVLDRVSRAAGLSGGLERMRTALTTLASAELPDDPDDELRRPTVDPAAANALLDLLDAFAAWITPPERATVADYAAWVWERTAGLRFETLAHSGALGEGQDEGEHPEGEAQSEKFSAWRRLQRVLEDLKRTAALLDTGTISYAAFLGDFAGAVATARYGRDDPREGAVAVLPVLAARGGSFAHVVVLGLNEGEFPRSLPDPPIYSRRERGLLCQRGVPITTPDPADEQSLFYEALARARTSITLCRTYLDTSGNPLPPSPYLRAVRDLILIPPDAITRSTAGSVPGLEEAASPGEVLVAIVEARRETRDNETRDTRHEPREDRQPTTDNRQPTTVLLSSIVHRPLWQHIERATAVERTREGSEAYGEFEGMVSEGELLEALAQRFGPQHRWSVTQLNDYITCPFLFFARHVLKLATQEEPEAALRGSVARTLRGRLDHAVLAETVRRWQQARLKPDSEQELLLQEFDLATTAVLEAAPERFGFAPDRFWSWDSDNVRQRLRRALRRTLNEGKDWAAFAPAAVEQIFGSRNVPPLRLDTAAGRVEVMGRIDRIDQRDDGSLAVIDYKSGSQPRPLAETLQGRDVQLPIYILAVEQVLPLGTGQQVERAAFVQTGSGKRSKPLTSAEREQASAILHERVAEVVSSVRDGAFTVRPRDTCPDYCVFIAICRVNLAKQ